MSFKAVRFAIDFPDLTLSERMVLIVLADRSGKTGHSFPSQAYIAKRGGMSIRTVRNAIKTLEGKKAIKRSERFNSAGRTSDDYLILMDREAAAFAATPRQNRPSIPTSPYGVGIEEEKTQPVMRIVGGVDHGN